MDFNLIAGARGVSGFDGGSVDDDVAVFDEALEDAAGNLGELGFEDGVEAFKRE
jgi:hypothetical protein